MSTTSAQGLTALSGTLLGLSTVAVALRFYARHMQKVPFKSDDWFMIPCIVRTALLLENMMICPVPESRLNKPLRVSRYCSLARRRVRFLVSFIDHPSSTRSCGITHTLISIRGPQEGPGISHPKRSSRSSRNCCNDIKSLIPALHTRWALADLYFSYILLLTSSR